MPNRLLGSSSAPHRPACAASAMTPPPPVQPQEQPNAWQPRRRRCHPHGTHRPGAGLRRVAAAAAGRAGGAATAQAPVAGRPRRVQLWGEAFGLWVGTPGAGVAHVRHVRTDLAARACSGSWTEQTFSSRGGAALIGRRSFDMHWFPTPSTGPPPCCCRRCCLPRRPPTSLPGWNGTVLSAAAAGCRWERADQVTARTLRRAWVACCHRAEASVPLHADVCPYPPSVPTQVAGAQLRSCSWGPAGEHGAGADMLRLSGLRPASGMWLATLLHALTPAERPLRRLALEGGSTLEAESLLLAGGGGCSGRAGVATVRLECMYIRRC